MFCARVLKATRVLSGTYCRNFTIYRQFHSELKSQSENVFAHNIMQHSGRPYNVLRRKTANVEQTTTIPLFFAAPKDEASTPPKVTGAALLERLVATHKCCTDEQTLFSDPRFDSFIAWFCEHVRVLNDRQLAEALLELGQHLAKEKTPLSRSHNYMEFWNTLDVEFCRRLPYWSLQQTLVMCDTWYDIGFARICQFVKSALIVISGQVRRMAPQELVHTAFLCNVTRQRLPTMYGMEQRLLECVDELSLHELGVVCMGFFKTQTPISNAKLLSRLYKRLIDELDDAEDITFVCLLKALRYSNRSTHIEDCLRLMAAILPRIDRYSPISLLHIALLGSNVFVCNDDLLEAILVRCERQLSSLRLKDIERICLALVMFGYESPTKVDLRIYKAIPEAIHRLMPVVLRYPCSFSNCVYYLAALGAPPTELIAAAFDKRFLSYCYDDQEQFGREYFHLDSYIKLNLAGIYAGEQFDAQQRQRLAHAYTSAVPIHIDAKLNANDRALLDIQTSLGELRLDAQLKHILPHYSRADVVLCYNEHSKRSVPISHKCPDALSGTLLSRSHLLDDAEAQHIVTVVFALVNRNNIVHNKPRHSKSLDLKLKQLRLLGHQPIPVYWDVWQQLASPKDRTVFLQTKLTEAISSISMRAANVAFSRH